MNFVNSFLLWTAAGASLPFLIHMLNREKPRRVVIPTVEFIIKAVEKSAGSRKLNNFLLLFVRMLILLCISMIIARPQIEKFLSLNSSGALQCVIIIDNSFYTAHNQSGSTQLKLIKEKARKIISSQPAGSQICILSTEESDSEFTEIKTYALDKIDSITPAPGLIDTRSMISSAADILKDSELKTSKKIYVISDMNQGSWEGNYTLDQKLKGIIHLVPVSRRRGNIYVSNVNIKSEGAAGTHRVYARRSVQILAEVRGDRSLEGIKATLRINNKIIDEKTVTEDLDGQITFNTSFDEDGAQFCEVLLDSSDGIEEDNIFYFTINVRPPAKVFILNDTTGRNPLFYKAALAPSGWHGRQKFNVLIMDYTQISTQIAQHSPELIILSGSMAISDSAWAHLKLFTEQGGALMICPDETTGYKELNQGAFSLLQAKVTPLEGRLKPIRASQSKLAERLDLEEFKEVQITKASTFEEEPSGATVEVPVRYSNNHACLLIRTVGLGEVVFWGLSPHTGSSTFLASDSFALIWHRLAERFSSGGEFQQNFSCGDSVEIQALKSELSEFRIQSPTGTVDRLTSDSFSLGADGDFSTSYAQTEIPGHYRCSSVKFGGFSCNIARESSYYQYVDEAEYSDMLSKDGQDNVKSATQRFFGPDGLLLILIMTTLALMIFEVHLGNRNFYAGD